MSHRRGQTTLEFALLVIVVIGAVLAMQIWLKRSVMGKLRESGDQVGEQFSAGFTNANYTTTINGTRSERTFSNGLQSSNITGAELQHRSGSENVTTNLANEQLFY